jgi:hypothetical protein
LAFERFAFGVLKFERLNRLNASKRSSRRVFSPPRPMALCRPRSNCAKPGPRATLRGALPNGCERSVGISTAAGFR